MTHHVLPSRRTVFGALAASAAAPSALAAVRGVDPVECGAVGDGRSNDLAGFTRAVAVAAERKLPVVVSKPHWLGLKGAADSIALPSGTTLLFQGGSLTYDYVGGPLLWGKDVADIRIVNPWIRFSGRMPTKLTSDIPEFFKARLQPQKPPPGRDTMAAIGIYGCRNVEITGARFEALNMSPDTLICRCIVIGSHLDGRPSENVTIRDFQADGFYFGIVAWGVNGLRVDGLHTRRWGQLDTTRYAWEAPSHPIYVTPFAPSTNVAAANMVDEGIPVGPYWGAGSTSFKFTGVDDGLTLTNLWSRRAAGLLDFHGRNIQVSKLFWQGTNGEAFRVNKVIRGLPIESASGEIGPGTMSDVHLILPSDMDDYPVALGGVKGDDMVGCTLSDWTIDYGGPKQNHPLIVASTSRCTWRNLRVNAPNLTSPYTVMRIDNGGSGNDIALSEGAYPHRFGSVRAGPGNTINGRPS